MLVQTHLPDLLNQPTGCASHRLTSDKIVQFTKDSQSNLQASSNLSPRLRASVLLYAIQLG